MIAASVEFEVVVLINGWIDRHACLPAGMGVSFSLIVAKYYFLLMQKRVYIGRRERWPFVSR
jgi:hypothetical protein